MKQYSKKLFSVAMLLSTAAVVADSASVSVSPFLQWRSQGRNTARKLVGTTTYAVDQPDMEGMYGTFNMTLEYDRSFRPQNISDALFGASLINSNVQSSNKCDSKCGDRCLLIQGINPGGTIPATIPNAKSWMAENFFLPNEFQSNICVKPLVQNILLDFDWYMGLDKWAKGLYFRLYGPVVNNRTNLNAEETLITPTSTLDDYTAGFVSPAQVPAANLFDNALAYFHGDALPNAITGVTYAPLAFAKWNGCGNMSKTGFAELRGEFGWNYLRENYRVGLNIQAAAPTGTRPKGEWLLEPQIGNGKHWELGAGFKALWTMWRSEDEEKRFDFVFEADVTHLFNAKQTRTFDLKGKPNSRYMLAEKLTEDVTPKLTQSAAQVNGTYSPVANFSTRDCKVSIGAQGDLVAMFTYAVRGFTWDLGYNFWGMSHEKISLSCNDNTNCPANVPFAENTWALKGNAYVYGTTSTASPATNFVALSATQSGATIHAGTNDLTDLSNAKVDSSVPATASPSGTALNVISDINATPTAVNQINTSATPVFIKAADFDVDGAQMRGYSNKIFTHFNYTWMERDRWVPYAGMGVSAEFGCNNGGEDCSNKVVTTTNNCDSSNGNKFALSQWAIWVKGGVSFH
jgi:hypothetical protein